MKPTMSKSPKKTTKYDVDLFDFDDWVSKWLIEIDSYLLYI